MSAHQNKSIMYAFIPVCQPSSSKGHELPFRKSRQHISVVVHGLCLYLYNRYHSILFWKRLNLGRDANAIDQLPVYQFWGFIDGTVRHIARSIEDQESYYSGHKDYHGIKYQSIVLPDGLIASLYGPDLGPTGDWKLWQESTSCNPSV